MNTAYLKEKLLLFLLRDDAYAADIAQDLRTSLMILPNWQVGSRESDGVRSLTGFYPPQSTTSNVSVLITGLGPDFTLVSGLDRSWQRPAGVFTQLIDYKASKGMYYIEYTLQNPGESLRHIYSALGVANTGTGWYKPVF